MSGDVTAEAAGLGPAELEAAMQELVDFVLGECGVPVDRWAVAATLESRGLRDLDAALTYQKWDLFDLAEEIYYRCRAQLAVEPAAAAGATATGEPAAVEPERPPLRGRLGRFLGLYGRGSFFVVPLAIQVASLLALGYNAWASLEFDNRQASAVAVALILSFAVTAGFSQALGRLGPAYLDRQAYRLARRISYAVVASGILAAALVGALGWLANALSGAFPERTALISLAYFLLLSLLALWQAALYMLHQWTGLVLTTVAAVATVGLLHEGASLGIHAAHWLGLGVGSAAALAWATLVLRRRAARAGGEPPAGRLPRASILAYATAPYFAYGVLYAMLLFGDRVVAWSVGDDPLPIWFRGSYEVGLDWAVIAVVPTLALLEYSVDRFCSVIVPAQARFSALRPGEHNRHFLRLYARHLLALALVAVAAACLAYVGVRWARHLDQLSEVRDFFSDPVTLDVFLAGVVGYSLLAWGLLNSVFLFVLARPGLVLRAIGPAAASGLAVGLVLSRGLDYWYAVVGMASGSLVFGLITMIYAIRVLRRADYYCYSAY